jgi:hypothetical protein
MLIPSTYDGGDSPGNMEESQRALELRKYVSSPSIPRLFACDELIDTGSSHLLTPTSPSQSKIHWGSIRALEEMVRSVHLQRQSSGVSEAVG